MTSTLGFSSFTSDINVILENTEDYLNPNGCCILRTVLKKGINAYYHPHEEQYILDKDIKFSMPKSVTKPFAGNYLIYDIDILHFSGGRALEKSGMKQQNPNKQIRKIVKKYCSLGHKVIIEKDYGSHLGFVDEEYRNCVSYIGLSNDNNRHN